MRDKTILIVGGDKRQQELFKILKEHYKNIFTYGLYEKESLPLKNDIIILPIPVTNDGIYINAPLTTRKISLEEISRYVDSKTKVFGGKMPDKLFFGSDAFIYDYNNNEALTIFNAALTADAAIEASGVLISSPLSTPLRRIICFPFSNFNSMEISERTELTASVFLGSIPLSSI